MLTKEQFHTAEVIAKQLLDAWEAASGGASTTSQIEVISFMAGNMGVLTVFAREAHGRLAQLEARVKELEAQGGADGTIH